MDQQGGVPWSVADVEQLRREIRRNTPTRMLALCLQRTPDAVQQKALELGFSRWRRRSLVTASSRR